MLAITSGKGPLDVLLSIEAQIGAFQNYLGSEYGRLSSELDCLKGHLVKVNDPWTGAPQGGMGY